MNGRTYPLRRVVGHDARMQEQGVSIPAVELECGHKVAPPEERRYPACMPCRFCAASQREKTDPRG